MNVLLCLVGFLCLGFLPVLQLALWAQVTVSTVLVAQVPRGTVALDSEKAY